MARPAELRGPGRDRGQSTNRDQDLSRVNQAPVVPDASRRQYKNTSCTILSSATVYNATSSRVTREPVAFGVTSN